MDTSRCKKKTISNYLFVLSFLFCISAFVVFFLGIEFNDAGWQLKTGEWIVQHGQIPRTVIGSWTSKKAFWLDHEWLYQIVMYLICGLSPQRAGIFNIFIYLISFAVWMKVMDFHELQANFAASAAMLYCFICILLFSVMYIRPSSFSLLFLGLLMLGMKQICDGASIKHVWWMLILEIFWTNMHGGEAALGFCLLIVVGILAKCYRYICINTPLQKSKVEVLSPATENNLILVGLLMALMCFVSPYGYNNFLYPFSNMADDSMQLLISEWKAPDIKDPSILVLEFIPMFLGIITVILSSSRIKLEKLLFLIVMDYLFLRSMRFASFSIMANAWIIFDCIPKQKDDSSATSQSPHHFVLMSLVLLIESVFVCSISNWTPVDGYDKRFFDTVAKYSNTYHVYNTYEAGDVMYYYGIPTFIDGRYEPFPKQIKTAWEVFLFNDSNSSEFKQLMKKYKINAVVISENKDPGVCAYVKSHHWQRIAKSKKGSKDIVQYELWINKETS